MKKNLLITVLISTMIFTACGSNTSDVETDLKSTEITEKMIMESEEETVDKIDKSEIIDFMKEYSIDIIKDGSKIYFESETNSFYNNEECSHYTASNGKEYSVQFYSGYETKSEELKFGFIVSDDDIDDIYPASVLFDNGTETIEYLSPQIDSYFSLFLIYLERISDISKSEDLENWIQFFESDAVKIIVKQTTGDEFTIELSSDTIEGVRAQLDILNATMEAAY